MCVFLLDCYGASLPLGQVMSKNICQIPVNNFIEIFHKVKIEGNPLLTLTNFSEIIKIGKMRVILLHLQTCQMP